MSWICPRCTYCHETTKEKEYLACAICSAPKPEVEAPFPPPLRGAKRQGRLLQHFQLSPQPKRQCIAKSSSSGSMRSVKNHPNISDALQPRPASSFVARAKYRDHSSEPWRELKDGKDLSKLCPLTVVKDVLPSQTAARLLDQLELESVTWNRGNWIVHGKEHLIPRTTATYNFNNANVHTPCPDDPHENIDNDDNRLLAVEEVENDDYGDVTRPISSELREATKCIAEVVRRHCPWAEQDWEPTFALASRYASGQECVGWHSDHIMKLGPRPIIVGLSLGACRRFELRKQTSNSNESASFRHVCVSLPHNSLCIMWNDAQESWQHSVPRCSDNAISRHPKVGLVRISLTFRRHKKLPDLGYCHCGRPAGLKAKEGRYYLFCVPYGHDKRETCNFWKPCPWAEEEAKRLVQLERSNKVQIQRL